MKVKNMTVQELLDMGADIDVRFHFVPNVGIALNKVFDLTSINPVIHRHEKTNWVKARENNLEVTAFYEPKTEPEHA